MLKAAVLLIFVATLPLIAQNNKEPQKWQQYSYPADGFTISAPSAPNIHPDPVTPDVTAYGWRFTHAAGGIHVGIRPQCMQMIDAFKEALRTGVSSTGLPAVGKVINLDGHPGIESIGKNKNGQQFREHIYCVGNKAYDITGIWITGQPEPPVLTRWLNSFRLTSGNLH